MKQNNMSMANSSMAGRLCRCRWTHVFRVPRACMAASLALAITWAFGGSINPNDYAKTSTITFSGYAGASTLTNFPALVKLDAGSVQGFDPADIQPNAADLRFTDSQFNELNYEIDTWDTNGALLIWVQIPELASNTLIRAFWDNASATTPAYTTNGATWANGYVAVWHFSETNGTTLADSVNGHNGTAAGGTVFSETGRIGSGGHFDGVDDTISVSNLAQLASQSQLTLSAWVKLDTLGSGEADDSCIFSQNDSTSPLVFWYNYTANTTGDKAYTFNVGPTSVLANRVNAGSGHVTSTWQHLAGVMLGTSRAIYIDGTFRGSATGAATTTGALTTGTIGSWEKLSNLAFDGALDEIRVANVARSADWVAAENATVSSSSFAEYGEVSEPDLSEIVFTAAPTVSVDSGNAISFSVDVASGEGSVYAIFDNGSSAITNLLGALTSTPTNFTTEVTGLTTNAYYTFSAYGVSQGASETSTAGSETLYIGAIWLEFIDNASEYGLVPGTVRVHRVNADDESLLVNYAFAGMTAVEGTNYEAPSGTATIQPGSSTVDIAVTPILDATTATDTTLSVNLATGYYLVGSPDSVEVVIENLETPAGKNVWVASAAGNASDAANWSQGVPQAGDDILLDLFSTADMTWDLDATNGLSASVASWTQTSNYTGTVSFPINYTHVAGAIFTNFTVTGNVSVEGGTWTHPANASTEDYRLFVTVGGNLTVASGASITATGKGYYNAGKNNGCHGGNANGVTGSTYGDPKYPTAIGACNSTSAGGGAILLDVSGAVVLNGAVTAAGVTAHESYGGAGGSPRMTSSPACRASTRRRRSGSRTARSTAWSWWTAWRAFAP